MNWDIYTLGGGAYLQMIFNGVAAFVGDGDYMLLLKMAMLIGILATIARSAYKGMLFDWQWFLGATMGFYVAFVPTATVIITDELDPSQSSVVENVPLGLAASAGIADEVGWWLTQKFDEYFSLPNDLQYDQHGMLFGNALVDATMRAEITDSRTAGNLSEFFQQCVFYDLLLGKYALYDLQTATDLWAFIQTNTSVARSFSYQPASGPATVEGCHDSANGDLNNDLNAAIPQTINVLGYNLVQADTRNDAIAAYTSDMPVAYQYFTGLADDATHVVMQATLANAMKRGLADWAASTNASAAAMDYSAAIAETQQRTSYTVMGELAQKYLPLLNNLLKAGIFAVFPIIFAMALLPGGWRVILTYAKTLAWIELWSPLFAIIHLGMTLTTATHAKGAITLGDGTQVLSMMTYSGLGQVMSDYSILAAYLTVLIPALSWAIVAGGGAVLSSGIQSVLTSYQRAADRAAGEATKGDIGLGNTSFGNASWWAQNEAPIMSMGSARYTDATGRTYTTTADGGYVQMPMSQLPVSMSLESAMRSAIDRQSGEATRSARSDAVEVAHSASSVLQEARALSHQLDTNKRFSDSVNQEASASFQRSYASMNSILDQVRQGTTLSREQTAQALLAMNGSIDGGISAGLNALGTGISGSVGASVQGHLQQSGTASISNALERAKSLGLDLKFGEVYASAARAGQITAASYDGADARGYAQSSGTIFSQVVSTVDKASASLERAETLQQLRSLSDSAGFGASIRVDDAFRSWLTGQLGGDEKAALDLIRNGAQTGDPAARLELERRISAFSRQYTDSIARRAEGAPTLDIEGKGDSAIATLRERGASEVANADAARRALADEKASNLGLISSTIDGRIEADRSGAQQRLETLRHQEFEGETKAAMKQFGARTDEEKQERYAKNVPLGLQALKEEGEALSKPLNVSPSPSPPHIPDQEKGKNDSR